MALPSRVASLFPFPKPLRILHTECSMGIGGQEYRVLLEALGMMNRGHKVIVAAPQDSQLATLAQQKGLRVHTTIPGNRGWLTLVPAYLRLIQRHNIHVVNTHGSLDSWTASMAGRISSLRPLVIRTRHKSTPVSPTFRHHLLYEKLPHFVTTTGEAVRQRLIQHNHLNPSRVFSIPTGVDLDRFHPHPPQQKLRERLKLGSQGPLVGTVTFLRPEKGIEVLIEAVGMLNKLFPDLKCLIIGDGEERTNLYARIRALGLEQCVHITGFRQDIPEMLALLDVFVLPSLEEGIPQALTQALAMERPVVATAVGGVPEVVKDGVTGLLVPPRNPQILSKKLAFFLNNPTLGYQMGQAGRQVIEKQYSTEHMLIQTEAVYRRWFEGRSSGSLRSS